MTMHSAIAPSLPQNVGIRKQSTVSRPTTIVQAFSREHIAGGLVGVALSLSLSLSPPSLAASTEPFLKSTGARGPLAQEEEELLRIRQQREEAAREELAEVRQQFVQETNKTKEGQFCATPFGIDVVGITEFVALTGALVGGLAARRRKEELERLNEQLRTINAQLRQQARAGTLYAPGLTYVPPTTGSNPAKNALSTSSRVMESSTSVKEPEATAPEAAAAKAPSTTKAAVSLVSLDEEDSRPEVKQCISALKEGKRLLKEQNGGSAMVRFEKALMLAKSLGDRVRERRAVRGLAAASRLSGQSRQAIKYLERVLEISDEVGDHVGDADAYGTIADCYTDMGEFEKAAEFYDRYISRMDTDGPV